jgi:hypothetical protein
MSDRTTGGIGPAAVGVAALIADAHVTALSAEPHVSTGALPVARLLSQELGLDVFAARPG